MLHVHAVLRTVSDIVSFDNLMAYAIAGAVLLSGGLMAMAVPGLLTPTAPLVLAAALVGTASAGAAAAYLYTPASVTAEVLAKSIEFASKPDVVQAISDGFRTSLFAIVDDFVSAAPSPLFLDTQLIWLDESHSSSNSDRAAAFAALRPLYSKPVLAATADEIRAWLVSNPDVGVVIIASGMHMAEQILPVLEQRALGGGGLAVKHAQVIDFFVVSADAAADTLAKAHPGIITCVHSSPSKAVDQVLHPPAKPIECLLPTFKWEARLATASTLSLDPAVQAAARGIDVGAAVDEFMKLRRGMAPPLPASYAFELSSRMRSLFSQDRSSTLVGAEEIIRFCTAEQEAPYCYPLFHKVVNVPFRTARKGVSGLKMAFLAERLETAMRLVYSARPDARPRPHVEGTRDLTLYHAFPVASDAQFNAFATAASGTLLYFRESMKVSTSRETAERSVPVDAMYRVLLCLACPEERLTSSAEGGSSPILLHALDSSAGVDDVLLEGLSLCTVSTAETSGERTVVISATLRQSVNASPFKLRAILL